MKKQNRLFVLLALWMSLTCSLNANATTEAPVPQSEEQMADKIRAFESSLKYQNGKIDLPGNVATLNLPDTFRYLSPDDAERVLVQAWGNPPGNKNLGMIFPADVSPLSREGWGVVITYDEDGHVSDADADKIDYDALLKDMQEATQEADKERVKQGYDSMKLVGWAERPSYDKASHKMYWAKELSIAGIPENTLNYNIRVLGRKGVLVLNAISSMNQISSIKQEMQKVVAFTNFNPGNTYADFNDKTDKVAEYGLAALVAGGVAAKLGFFGKLFALLIAFKKLLIIGVIAVFAAIKKFFGGSKAA